MSIPISWIPKWIRERSWASCLCLDDPLTIDELNNLLRFLESNRTDPIHTIILSRSISKASVEAVFKGLQQNSTIHTLTIHISNPHLTINEWGDKLDQTPSVTALQLLSHSESSESIQPWIRSLQLNSTISCLKFRHGRFDPSEVTELIDLLSSNYTVNELVIELNSPLMSTDDFARLCNYLKSDRFIKALSVIYVDQPVRDGDALELAQVLQVNNALMYLKLDGEGISSSERSALAEALNSNSTLISLILPYNCQDANCHILITSQLQRNRDLVHNPLELLLRQTELTKEVEERRLIKQRKVDDYNQSLSSPPSMYQSTDGEEKGEEQSVKNKSNLELSSMVSPPITVQSPVSVPLNPHEVEYVGVSRDFYQSFAVMPEYDGLKFNITQIERITNSALKDQFDQSYRYFKSHNYHSTQPIRSVYHGTNPANIPSIIQSNLNQVKAGSVTDSGWFGRGMYFSPHADYVMMYNSTGQFKRVTAGDSGKILQFDILPGRMLRMKDVKIGGDRTLYYDSHVSPNEFEYVMFDSRHILPRYVISFNVVQGLGSKFGGSMENLGPHHPNYIKPQKVHSTKFHSKPKTQPKQPPPHAEG